ncbi:heat shock protein HslJ [Balneicella halophila]|uniref:Heat shock protein HslJ n=1 Tax=Balneicella halophila TaxID=1537566 RepID=A0A7L4URQ2_BALHA|nr:META domain-containing protein [Balneicella halophila]PVX52111.1 heat shock protein HslJ [Balneicella halophila]
MIKNTRLFGIATIVSLLFLIVACTPEEKTETFWVNSYKTTVDNDDNYQLLVSESDNLEDANWDKFENSIEGFTFKPGYFQKIEVKVEDVEGQETKKYTLKDVLEEKLDMRYRLNDTWVVVAIDGKDVEKKEDQELPQLEMNLSKGQVSGTDGCNRIFGQITEIKENTIKFDKMGSTRMACPDMETPDAFMSAFAKVKQYKLNDLELVLLDENNNEVLKFKKVD